MTAPQKAQIRGSWSRLAWALRQDPIQKITKASRNWWLTPIILATQEAEIKRIAVQSQPWANSS
jgi:hypothetical protein